jgi:hypothetical protein
LIRNQAPAIHDLLLDLLSDSEVNSSYQISNMSETDPNLTALADRLPADVYYCLVYSFRDVLPTPRNSSPQHLARRDNALIARLAALRPATPIEAEIAADYIIASEHARECLRIALARETSPEWAMKCRAQHNAMMRQSYGALRRLERMQKERRKLEKDSDACNRETWTEHCVIGLIGQAFAELPDPDAELLNEIEPIDDGIDPNTLTPEQQKAIIHRQRAALIRRLNQALEDPNFDRTVAEIIAHPGDSFWAEPHPRSAGPPPG